MKLIIGMLAVLVLAAACAGEPTPTPSPTPDTRPDEILAELRRSTATPVPTATPDPRIDEILEMLHAPHPTATPSPRLDEGLTAILELRSLFSPSFGEVSVPTDLESGREALAECLARRISSPAIDAESMISAMDLDGLMGEMTGEPDAGELADLVFAGTLLGCW